MSIDFSGSSGEDVDLGNPSHLRITGGFTASIWLCLNSSPQNVEIVTKQTAGDRGWSLQTDDDGGGNTFGNFIIAKTSSTTMQSGWPSFSFTVGVWYLVTGQYDPGNSVRIYVNDKLENETTADVPATMYDPGNSISVAGRPSPDSNSNLDGKLEGLRLFNRVISLAEIATIYVAQGHSDGILNGDVGNYMLNENAPGVEVSGANSVIDVSKYLNHGTPGGSGSVYAESVLRMRG